MVAGAGLQYDGGIRPGSGEAAAIRLAIELGIGVILIDERRARCPIFAPHTADSSNRTSRIAPDILRRSLRDLDLPPL